jgi:hypothetical protein
LRETVGTRLLKDSSAVAEGSDLGQWQKENLPKDLLEEEGSYPWQPVRGKYWWRKGNKAKKILLHIRFIISLQPYSEPTPKIDALTA